MSPTFPFSMRMFIVVIMPLIHHCKLGLCHGHNRLFVCSVHGSLEQEEIHTRPWARWNDRLDFRLSPWKENEYFLCVGRKTFMTRRAGFDRVDTCVHSTISTSWKHREMAIVPSLSFRYVGGWVWPILCRHKCYILVSVYSQENHSRNSTSDSNQEIVTKFL